MDRQLPPSGFEGLLPKETGTREEAQRRRHLPGTAPLRRYLLHAQKRHSLRGETRPSRLTKSIGTPPQARPNRPAQGQRAGGRGSGPAALGYLPVSRPAQDRPSAKEAGPAGKLTP